MKKFKVFSIIMKVLIPFCFAAIAVSEGKLYWIGGVMTILVLFYYGIQWFGVKSIDNEKIKV